MPKVAMLDLAAQRAPLAADLEAAACRVLRSQQFILGSEVAAFEAELAAALGIGYAVGVSSGSDALLAMLAAANVGRGDQVITTPFSFFATAGAIVRLGATPLFADVDPRTGCLDDGQAAAMVGPRTRAVLVVHLYGRLSPTAALEQACARHGIPLLEDAAQAIGAHDEAGRTPGSIGAAAALSFFPTKNLGGFGDGGAVLARDGELARRVRRLRVHGASQRFVHEEVGGSFRLDELQAALLRVALPHVAGWTARRRRLAAAYRRALAGSPLQLPPPDDGCVWNQFVVRVPDRKRDALAAHLRARGIDSAVYYPRPLHLQPALAYLGGRAGQYPAAERLAAEGLALPIHPALTDGQLLLVAQTIAAYFGARGLTAVDALAGA